MKQLVEKEISGIVKSANVDIQIAGQSRVIIENVQPQVENGRHPAKRSVGDLVQITADIFADGHDHIRAEVCYRKKDKKKWMCVPMEPEGNDLWCASFKVDEKGMYVYTVQAWIDHFETWYAGFKKKVAAKIDVSVEILEGFEFLKKLEANGEDTIANTIKILESKKSDKDKTAFFLSPEFEKLVADFPLKEFETTIETELPIIVESRRAEFTTWYELFPRSASTSGGKKHGTFKDVIKLLPRIELMGFDVLYLPPIHPIGTIHRKGPNNSVTAKKGDPGSPWAIGSAAGGHKAVHPELGEMSDYENLIKEAKKRGIDIALDLAFQCAPDHPYVKEHPEWFKKRPDGTIQYAENPPKKYQDIYPFDFECEDWKNLWDELKSITLFWIDKGITIFRVDNPHTKPIPFWEWMITEVHKEHPDIIFLAEAFTRPKIMNSLAKVGFNQSYTYFTWRVNKQEIVEYMNELVAGPSRNFFRPNFWPNTPDILPYHFQHQDENIFIIRLALAATLSANYGIYGPPYEFGENVPIDGKEEYTDSEKYEIKQYDWKRTNRMTDIITLINKARKEQPALQSTWNIYFCQIENSNLLAFIKYTEDFGNIMLVVVNLDQHNKHQGYLQIPKSLLRLGDSINIKLHDLITEDRFTWTQEWNYVELDPNRMPFHLFKLEIQESHM